MIFIFYNHVDSDNEGKMNKRVVSNKKVYTGKKCQKIKCVYMFIRKTRVLQ